MLADGAGLVTLYAGEDLSEVAVETDVEMLQNNYDDADFEWYVGGQAIYPYLVSAE